MRTDWLVINGVDSQRKPSYLHILLPIGCCLASFLLSVLYLEAKHPRSTRYDSFIGSLPLFLYPRIQKQPLIKEITIEQKLFSTITKPVPATTDGIEENQPMKKLIKLNRVKKQASPQGSPVTSRSEIVETPIEPVNVPIIPPNHLDRIRGDKDRIYVSRNYEHGEIEWGVRNISPLYGVEVMMTHRGETNETYYLPMIIVDGTPAVMESKVLSPGMKIFGYLEYPYIRRKTELAMTLKMAGKKEVNERLKIKW